MRLDFNHSALYVFNEKMIAKAETTFSHIDSKVFEPKPLK